MWSDTERQDQKRVHARSRRSDKYISGKVTESRSTSFGRLKDDHLNMPAGVEPPIRRGRRSKPRCMDAVNRDGKLVKRERNMADDRIW